ncbi:hypothetical protein BDB00DRAFT_752034, partial [Zychaea mexicana]|uniref:uncharacterized protein n=1 Tax=Zychaea mexicana TaxID=64656 RepID=UPI0022FEF7D8
FNGLGTSLKDKVERLLIECSGQKYTLHNQEDFLKLLKCISACLQLDMMKYHHASSNTFKQRQIFSIHITLLATTSDGMHIICIEVRSVVVPIDWEDYLHWIKVFELLVKLK